MKIEDVARLQPSADGYDTWRTELIRFCILAVMGVAASYFSVTIPNTDVFIEGRWLFGFMGFALLRHRWTCLLLAAVLHADTVYLRNGNTYKGSVLEETEEHVRIRPEGKDKVGL